MAHRAVFYLEAAFPLGYVLLRVEEDDINLGHVEHPQGDGGRQTEGDGQGGGLDVHLGDTGREGTRDTHSFITFGPVRGACVRSAPAECVWWGRTGLTREELGGKCCPKTHWQVDRTHKQKKFQLPEQAERFSSLRQWAMHFFIGTRWGLVQVDAFRAHWKWHRII